MQEEKAAFFILNTAGCSGPWEADATIDKSHSVVEIATIPPDNSGYAATWCKVPIIVISCLWVYVVQ